MPKKKLTRLQEDYLAVQQIRLRVSKIPPAARATTGSAPVKTRLETPGASGKQFEKRTP